LFGGETASAAQFDAGIFTTLYLSPRDYHRIHMPFAGTLTQMIHVPGRLFSVNPPTTRAVPRLFARNERVVTVFDTGVGPMAVIMVGALNVGSIETIWAGEVTPPRGRKIRRLDYRESRITLDKGAELGRFNMGSTVILLFAADRVRWESTLAADQTVRMGQRIATLL
jgi:phosphatidylserine decarboxylase